MKKFERSDTPIVGCSPEAEDYVTECQGCGRDVDMKRLVFDSGKDLNRVRGFMGVCSHCKANTVDAATLELLESMGTVTRVNGLQ